MEKQAAYLLYGMVPTEHDDKNTGVDEQRVQPTVKVYETDDLDEAKKYYKAGGFEREGDGVWVVVTGVKRTADGGNMGVVPRDA